VFAVYFTNLDDLAGADFQLIASDCPWRYKDTASAGERGAVFKYPVLSLEDIAALPVRQIAAKDCVLACWTTGPFLVDGSCERVIRAWGFTPKTMAFTWVKKTKHGKWFWGMGRWTRSNPEYCVLATRGNPKRVSAGVHSVLDSPIGEHSAKPPEYRDRLVQLCGDVARLEMFARGDVEDGWDRWGNSPHGIQDPRTIKQDYAEAA
jgi:N6-adenosine-specific RNA methylase IME4